MTPTDGGDVDGAGGRDGDCARGRGGGGDGGDCGAAMEGLLFRV